MLKRLSLASQIFVLQLAVILTLVVTATLLVFLDVRRDVQERAELRALTLATGLADTPDVREAVSTPDPGDRLRATADAVMERTGTDFVVFMTTEGIRYSHPRPDRVGKRFLGTIEPAVAGEDLTETYDGTLGPSVRAVVPIRDESDEIAALLAVGILQEQLGARLQHRLEVVLGVASAALLVAVLGSLAVTRRLKRLTLGLGAEEITRLYEHHDAVLRTVREGLLIVSPHGRLVLVNDQARQLLDLAGHVEGRPVRELGLHPPLDTLLPSGEPAEDQLVAYGDRVLAIHQEAITHDGRPAGTVTTLRDHTEIEALAGELDSERGFAEALRAQAHESTNRLHTVTTLVELGQPERAVEFATGELALAQALTDRLAGAVREPALAALLLGKASQAAERGVELVVTDDTTLAEGLIAARDLVTVVGNLVDNAIDAALAAPPPRTVTVTLRVESPWLVIRVADTGPGVGSAQREAIFGRGWSTKTGGGSRGRGIGLALVRQVITRHDGQVVVGDGGGAVFTVRLRVPDAGVPGAAAPGPGAPGAGHSPGAGPPGGGARDGSGSGGPGRGGPAGSAPGSGAGPPGVTGPQDPPSPTPDGAP